MRFFRHTKETDEFWARVRWLAKARGYSLRSASTRMQRNESFLRHLLHDSTPLSPENLKLFCDALNIPDIDRKELTLLAVRGLGYEL